MTVSGPRVQDFTDRQRRLLVTVEADPVYETLLALFVYHGCSADSGHEVYEDGSTFIERIEQGSHEDLLADLDSLKSRGELWLTLIGIAHDSPAPRTMATFLDHLAELDVTSLRTMLMRNSGIKPSRGYDADLIARAAGGDLAAVDEIFAGDDHHDDAIHKLLAMEPEASRSFLISVLRRFHDDVGEWIERVGPVLRRDASATRALAHTMSPEGVVERATNGITFEMQPQVSGVLLIPSVIIRPWVVISEHRGLRIFCYSVSDEQLAADPDAPPTFMVELFKALGDERRLRILGALAEGEMGLRALAERVELAKSTVHHHMRVLRSAGLVRVVVGEDDKRYGLRRDTVPEVSRLLGAYLGAAGHAATDSERNH